MFVVKMREQLTDSKDLTNNNIFLGSIYSHIKTITQTPTTEISEQYMTSSATNSKFESRYSIGLM